MNILRLLSALIGVLAVPTFVTLAAPGDLDTSFNATGMRQLDEGYPSDLAFDVAVQPDGKIVVVGRTEDASDDIDYVVARVLANGTPDTGFGTGGTRT